MQATCGNVTMHHLQQAGFVNGYAAFLQDLNLGRIEVQAQDVIADFRQTGTCYKTNVASADYGNFHRITLLKY
jgi:hypothetical protein